MAVDGKAPASPHASVDQAADALDDGAIDAAVVDDDTILLSDDPDFSLLRDVGAVMKDASICGLGQTAHNAIETAIVRLGILS